ncbi:hypothetical protein BDQ17DRAFT_1432642 [Cyathus striatus]|nr:hypothetical protein BDQ17DRAFT_1432642 [Cyathus striatus]
MTLSVHTSDPDNNATIKNGTNTMVPHFLPPIHQRMMPWHHVMMRTPQHPGLPSPSSHVSDKDDNTTLYGTLPNPLQHLDSNGECVVQPQHLPVCASLHPPPPLHHDKDNVCPVGKNVIKAMISSPLAPLIFFLPSLLHHSGAVGENSNKPLVEPEESKPKTKKPKKTSTQRIQEDIKEDAKGAPEKLTKAAKILEIGGDAVAPPPIIWASASTLPPWPMRVISSDIEDELNTEQADLIVQKNMESGSKAEIGTKAGSESKDETGSKAETGSNIEHGLDADLVDLNKQKDVEIEIANKMQVDTQTGIGGSNMNAGELDEKTDKEEYEKRAESEIDDHSYEESEKEKSAENVNENNTFEMKDNNKDGSEEMSSENEEEEDNDENENFENITPKKAKSSRRSTSHKSAATVPSNSPSPIELEGASRTHGGFSRGRAFGNTFNSADFDKTNNALMHIEESDSGSVMGRVIKYSDHSKQSPPFVVTQPLGTKLGDILHNICVEYEYTAIQWKIPQSLEKNETVPWIKDEKGKYSISLSAESISEMVPALPVTLGGGTTSQHMKPSGSTATSYPFELDSVQYKIASAFNVSKGLCERNVKKDIRISYQKYLAIHDIFAKFPGMIANNIWKEKRPSNDDIIEVFMSKSTYYFYYSNLFSMAPQNPGLDKWLKGDSDAPHTGEVWGHGVKPSLDNLKKLLDNIKSDYSSSENAE